jgi:hypothetical protein
MLGGIACLFAFKWYVGLLGVLGAFLGVGAFETGWVDWDRLASQWDRQDPQRRLHPVVIALCLLSPYAIPGVIIGLAPERTDPSIEWFAYSFGALCWAAALHGWSILAARRKARREFNTWLAETDPAGNLRPEVREVFWFLFALGPSFLVFVYRCILGAVATLVVGALTYGIRCLLFG